MSFQPEIEEFDFGDGDVALGAEFSIAPFGTALIVAEDVSDDSRRIMKTLIAGWENLWPEMLDLLQDGMEDYEVEQKLGRDEFMGSIGRMKPGCYMGDKSDFHLRLEFDEPPLWDYFLKGTNIVHFQSVF